MRDSSSPPAHSYSVSMRGIKSYLNHRASRAGRSFSRLATIGALLILFALTMQAPLNAISSTETVSTFASDCATPDNSFVLGDTVCAVATGSPLPSLGFRQRRIQWLAPDGFIANQVDITTDPQSDSFTIPTSGVFAQVGTWSVRLINNRSTPVVIATFTVRDPANSFVDLSVIKVGPEQVAAGSNVTFTVIASNRGPDDAQNVELTDMVPANTTFVSSNQDSGPAFTCNTTSDITTCSIESLPAGQTALFTFVYSVSGSAPDDSLIFNTANVSSSTTELHQPDNTFTATTTVRGSTFACTIICPGDVTVESTGCGATATYSAPSSTGDCGTVVCSPPSGSTFPNGITTVTCGGDSGSPCSFTVTVIGGDATPPVISCPSDITAAEEPAGSGAARVDFNTPGATDNCAVASVMCEPSSGSLFEVGTTTVTCTATDESGNTASCSFTVTVTGNGCTLECPGDITATADSGQCSAVVNYPAPTSSEGCGTVTCSPASGTTFSIGATEVTCTSSQGPSCSFTVTVIETIPPTITTCATNKTISADSSCQATIPDLTGEVVATDNCSQVSISQAPPAGTVVEVGTTQVTLIAEDTSGNQATCIATVTVTEATPPTIICPLNITATAAIGQLSAAITFPNPTVTDNCSVTSVVCLPPSGSDFPLGITTVICTATDQSGNQASCTFKVAVSGTLIATADSFLRDGADNTNEGANERLRIQSSGHNRVLVRFDLPGVSTSGLQSATLVLNIAENSDNWGSSGRLVDAHRLLAEWTEGNGHNIGDGPNFRGTGEGVTWKCAKDANISNQNDDCTAAWNGGAFAAATAASVLHTNNQTGDVSWSVTADVIAGANNGWLIKKQSEGQAGQVRYYSREGAALAGNSNLAPRLVLVYLP